MLPLIEQIDAEEITPADLFDVMNGDCINCYRGYSRTEALMFVRVGKRNRLIWWHLGHCTAVARPYKRKGYLPPAPDIEQMKKGLPHIAPIPPPNPHQLSKQSRLRNRNNYYNP